MAGMGNLPASNTSCFCQEVSKATTKFRDCYGSICASVLQCWLRRWVRHELWELPRRLECWRTIADLVRLSPRHLWMFSCTQHVFAMETSTVLYEHRGSEALEKQT